MYNYKEICELLAAAVSMTIVPNYNITPAIAFKDEFNLQRKIEFRYKNWIDYNKNAPPLSCIGCCEIDQYTGNDLLRIFHDITSKHANDRPGKFLYFSKSQRYCAAMLCTRFKPMFITPFFEETNENLLQYRYLFTKLFDDDEILTKQNNTANSDSIYFHDNIVKKLRQEGFDQFPIFLNERIANFPLPYFGYSFLGLLAAVSFRINPKGNPQNQSFDFSLNIPFAACVRLAFAQNLTGKLSELMGEVGYKVDSADRRNRIKNIAKDIIFKSLPPDDLGMWDEVQVQAAAKEIKEYFSNN